MNRRNLIKKMGLVVGITALPDTTEAFLSETPNTLTFEPNDTNFDNQGKTKTLGTENRRNIYGDYHLLFPVQIEIINVAKSIRGRNKRYVKKHNNPKNNRLDTRKRVFEHPKFTDAGIISTPDQLHCGLYIRALEMGYDMLLKKPIPPSGKECLDIPELTKKIGRIVTICQALKYTHYFRKLKRLIENGAVDNLINADHFESFEHAYMAHSYFRGNCHNSKTSTSIMAKSYHSMDIMRWQVAQPGQSFSTSGNLEWFRQENAPMGASLNRNVLIRF